MIDAEAARIKAGKDHEAAIKKAQDDAAKAIEKAKIKAAQDKRDAEFAQASAIQKALEDAAVERQRLAEIEAKRSADLHHRMGIDAAILRDLYALIREIPSDAAATANDVGEHIFRAIRDGRVSHVTINY